MAVLGTAVAGVLLAAGPASASELEQRLEQLEAEVQSLRQQLREEREAADDAPPAAGAEESPASAGSGPSDTQDAVVPAIDTGEVRVRYFLESQPLQDHPPDGEPLAAGLVAFEGAFVMDPVRYGAPPRGLLDRYADPSVHRAAGLLLEGTLDIPEGGLHRLQFSPKPAREGGSSVVNEMIVRFEVAGEEIVAMDGVRSWRSQSFERELPAGRHPFRLWVVSNSPGYGPAPTDSRLDIGVQMPGRAEVTPLRRLMSAPAD